MDHVYFCDTSDYISVSGVKTDILPLAALDACSLFIP